MGSRLAEWPGNQDNHRGAPGVGLWHGNTCHTSRRRSLWHSTFQFFCIRALWHHGFNNDFDTLFNLGDVGAMDSKSTVIYEGDIENAMRRQLHGGCVLDAWARVAVPCHGGFVSYLLLGIFEQA